MRLIDVPRLSALVERIDCDLPAMPARELIDEFCETQGGVFRDRGFEMTLRVAGVVTSCTSGPAHLLRNWQQAARRRIAEARERGR